MSAKALHALLTLVIGFAVGLTWLRVYWNEPRRPPAHILLAPIAVGLLGLGHWVAYDFAVGHWAGDFSLAQALFNFAVAGALALRRSAPGTAAA